MTDETDYHDRRGPDGQFITKRAVDTDMILPNEANTVGKVAKRYVSDDVEFHPVNVELLEKIVSRAREDDTDHIMLAVPTQHTKDGAKTCMMFTASVDDWWNPRTRDGEQTVHVACGASYTHRDGYDDS